MPRKINKEPVRVSFLSDDSNKERVSFYQRKSTLVIVFVLIVGAILVASIYLRVQTANFNEFYSQADQSSKSLAAQLQEAQGVVGDKMVLGGLINAAKGSLDKHTAGENILTVLEKTTVPEVELQDIAVDTTNSIVLSVHAKDFSAVEHQLIAWRSSAEVQSVKVSSINTKLTEKGAIEGVDFSASLILDPSIFYWNP